MQPHLAFRAQYPIRTEVIVTIMSNFGDRCLQLKTLGACKSLRRAAGALPLGARAPRRSSGAGSGCGLRVVEQSIAHTADGLDVAARALQLVPQPFHVGIDG